MTNYSRDPMGLRACIAGLSPATKASMAAQLVASPLLLIPGFRGAAAFFILAQHVGLAVAGLVPRSRVLGPNDVRLTPAQGVALTFDDGPDPDITPAVLDLLAEHGVRATFFVVGEQVQKHPELVLRMVDEGHRVENHTQRHSWWFWAYSAARIRAELGAAQRSIQAAGAPPPSRFRAPAGVRSPWLEPVLRSLGLRLTTWSCRGFDTSQADPSRVTGRLLEGLEDGAILLLHDRNAASSSVDGAPMVLSVLPRLLSEIERRGLRTRTIDETDGGFRGR